MERGAWSMERGARRKKQGAKYKGVMEQDITWAPSSLLHAPSPCLFSFSKIKVKSLF